MKFYIKYMVSNRCKMFVRETLDKLGFHCVSLELGEVEILENISSDQKRQFDSALRYSGLELL